MCFYSRAIDEMTWSTYPLTPEIFFPPNGYKYLMLLYLACCMQMEVGVLTLIREGTEAWSMARAVWS